VSAEREALRAEVARLEAENARLREACEDARAMLPERYFGALYLKLTADLAPPTFPAPEDEAAFADGYTAAYRDAPEQTQTQTRGNIAMGPERRDGMAKFIEIEMPDLTVWRVPAEVVAASRAAEYPDEPEVYADTLASRSELLDWAANNMNWEDVAARAVKVRTDVLQPDYQEGWVNGPKRVIEEAA